MKTFFDWLSKDSDNGVMAFMIGIFVLLPALGIVAYAVYSIVVLLVTGKPLP